jgi:hypothetical protein
MTGIKVENVTKLTLNGVDIEKILDDAASLAHHVLEELSIYRQRHGMEDDFFDCEAEAWAFLDLIDD